ncbi:MAG: pre-peptidase C-terminal domain-containing protein [Saprospiraceae bacterium]|nr:pre-peptidase C-terminal domain-containing protein [Saprospiraceae bacterium]
MRHIFTLLCYFLVLQTGISQFDCQNAITLSCGQTISDNNGISCKNIVTSGYCGTNYNLYTAPEKVYKFTVTATQNVTVKLTGLTADLDLFLLRSCCAADCIAKSDQPPAYNYETVSANLSPGTYYLIVDGWSGAVSPFHLSLICNATLGHPDCSTATPLTCNTTIESNTSSGINNTVGPYCNNYCNYGGKEKVYYIDVTAKSTVNIHAGGFTGDLDLFLLNNCNRNACVAISGKSGANAENISIVLEPGRYYIVLDGYEGAVSPFNIGYSCTPVNVPLDCNSAIHTNYSGNGSDLKFNFVFTSGAGYQFKQWRYNTTVLSTNPNVNLVFQGAGTYNICADYINTSTGQIGTCCKKSCISLPVACEDVIQYQYINGTYKLSIAGNNANYQNVVWRNDTDGVNINPENVPSSCRNLLITVRYYDTASACWVLCCRNINFCAPTSCQDNINYAYQPTTNSFQFSFNHPSATQLIWKFDEDNSVISGGVFTLPQGWTCTEKTVSVYYYDTVTKCWKVCCRKITICPPINCETAIQYNYVPAGNKYQFTLNIPGASHLVWKFDEDNTILPDGMFSIPQNWVCKDRTVSVYYFNPATQCWSVCCKKVTICPPSNCEASIQYSYSGNENQFQFTLNVANAQHVIWKFDEDGTVLPNGTFTIPNGWVCKERTVSVYYFDPSTQCWKVCCKKVTICPPSNCESSIQYTYDATNDKYVFTLNIPGVQHVIWKFDEDGLVLPGGSFTVPTGWTCVDKTVSVYYFNPSTQCWSVCCKKINICPPANCQERISHAYNTEGTSLQLTFNNAAGVQNLQWIEAESGHVLGTNATIHVPVTSVCGAKTYSAAYLENGAWKMCCKRIYVCNPSHCTSAVTQTNNATSVTLSINPAYTDVKWANKSTGVVLGTGNQIQISLVNGALNIPVVASYYDPVSKYFNACSNDVIVTCHLPVAGYTYTIAGAGVNFTSTSTATDTYVWSFVGGTPAAGTTINSQNPVAVFSSGTYNVCLTASNSCGSNTFCQTITVNTGHDCSFSIPSNICGTAGQDVLIPVKVSKFTDVLTFNFTLRCSDPSKLSFIGLEQYNSTIENGSNHYIQPDHVRFFWSQATSKTLPDQSALFYIRCRLSNTATAAVNIFFSDDPVKAEAYGGNLQKLNLELVNGSACINALPTGYNIGGVIKTHTLLKNMPATEVQLITNPNNMNVTNNEGKFSFNEVASGNNVIIKPSKNTDHLNGVNALDIVRLQRHLLLIDPLVSPYKLIAADVNNDNTVNALDVVVLQRMQLRLIEQFPNNTSWRFVPMAYQFGNTSPFAQAFPENITYNTLNANQMQSDFYAIKVGDLDDSNTLGGFSDIIQGRNIPDTVGIKMASSYVIRDSIILIPVKAKDFKRMAALEGTIKWDSLKVKFLEVTNFGLPALSDQNFARPIQLGHNILTFNWVDGNVNGVTVNDDKTLFILKFKALGDVGQSTRISWSDQPLPLFAANADLSAVKIKSADAIINFIQPLTAAAKVNDITCANLQNGSVQIEANGGTGNFVYIWPELQQFGSSVSNLAKGQYSCTVMDTIAGLEMSVNTTVNAPEELAYTATISENAPSVYQISIQVTGGVAPYRYIWDNGNSSKDITVNAPGIYNVIIIDSNDCSVKGKAEIMQTISSSEQQEIGKILVNPNPASDHIFIKNITDKMENQSFSIFNVAGQKVYTGLLKRDMVLDVTEFMQGVYTLKLESSQSIRFIVIR